jgi:hypothetical protein
MSAPKYLSNKGIFIEKASIKFLTSNRLTKTAVIVLLLFLKKRQLKDMGRQGKVRWVIVNNGEIVFPYCEAKNKYGIPATTFSRAIDQLIKFGLIDINHHGGGMAKDMTTYYISDRWRDYGIPDFKEKSRRKDTRGLGFTKKNWEERSKKKRRTKLKISNENVTATSNKNVTAYRGITHPPSNKNVTEEIDPNFFIYKGEEVFRHFQLRSNINVTIL